jgi:hypothetical protein
MSDQQQRAEQRGRAEEAEKTKAKAFADAIMDAANIVEIPDGDGMLVMQNIPDLEAGSVVVPNKNIIIRKVVEAFWKACIACVDENGDDRWRVCAVGTPGIGKATTTP